MNVLKDKLSLSTACSMLLAVGLGITSASVFAGVDNNGAFQLDGNAFKSDQPFTGGDDWDTLYNGGANDGGTGSSTVFTGIDVDKNGTDDIFTGGGSKTPNLIEDWDWKSSPPPPDKDNITDGYAANYSVNSEQIVYFGADLFADNGDAELAFWFFQNKVSKVGVTSGTFDGHHVPEAASMSPGDPYVAVKFSNGGTLANIAVFEWDPTCTKPPGNGPFPAGSCAADNIRVVIEQGPATCNTGGDKLACAITNTAAKPSPWPYTPKSGTPGTFPINTLFEGGINIKQVLGQNLCFSSFMATTGASTSFTATAKDFVLGDFNVCSVAATKQCTNDDETDDTTSAITYNVRGCGWNNGGGDINLGVLTNSINGGMAATPIGLTWYVPGQVDDGTGMMTLRDFDPATDCNDELKLAEAIANGSSTTDLTNLAGGDALLYEFTETSASNAPSDTVTIPATGTDGTPITAATASDTCPLRTFNAALSLNKQCAADLEDAGNNIVVKIGIQGQVCNEGEVTLTGLMLADDADMPASGTVALTPVSTTLAPKGETGDCTNYTGSYYPASIPSGDICPFADQVTATATAPVNSTGDNCALNEDLTSTCTADSNTATCNLRAVDTDGDCSTGPLSTLPSP